MIIRGKANLLWRFSALFIGIINGLTVALLAAHAQTANPEQPASPPALSSAPSKPASHLQATASAAKKAKAVAPKPANAPQAQAKRDYRQAAKRSSRGLVLNGLQHGRASWYRWRGGYYAAHRYLPKGTRVKVTNVRNGRSVWVTINDRGPFIRGRVIDLQPGPYTALFGSLRSGTGAVKLEW